MPRHASPWSLKNRNGFWYIKLRGENVYHSTGIPVGNERVSRPKAVALADQRAGVSTRARTYKTFGEYADRYFRPEGCPWFDREHGRGNHVQEHYRDQHRSRLELHILPAFRNHRFDELSSIAIEDWLYSLDYSTQWKKHIYETLRIVLGDLKRDRLLSFDLSEIKPPVVTHDDRQVPTDAEAAALFPEDLSKFKRIWGKRFRLGVLNALAYSSGLRTSELRALRWPAVHRELKGLVVVVTINRDNRPDAPKAKSVRAVPLPDWTLDLLDSLPGPRDDCYVFPGHSKGAFLQLGSPYHALLAICRTKDAKGQPLVATHISPHSLRHAYNTRMRAILAEAGVEPYFDDRTGFRATTKATDAVLRAFTGHKTPDMTNLYDHPELVGALRFYNSHFREYINRFWDFRRSGTSRT